MSALGRQRHLAIVSLDRQLLRAYRTLDKNFWKPKSERQLLSEATVQTTTKIPLRRAQSGQKQTSEGLTICSLPVAPLRMK